MDKGINFIKLHILFVVFTSLIFVYCGLSLHGLIKASNFINYGYLILFGYFLIISHTVLVVITLYKLMRKKEWKKLIIFMFLLITYALILIGLMFIVAITSGYLGDM
jgi:hypothetical protein